MSDIKNLFLLQGYIREFFKKEEFLEVLTPPLVPSPGIETHIHPLQVISNQTTPSTSKGFLHTSPEFWMKHLLSLKLEKIFTMSYCFRDEPDSMTHRNQFVMLEWYRRESSYEEIMNDTIALISYCYERFAISSPSFISMTVDHLFQKELGFSILDYLDKEKLKTKIKNDFQHLYQAEIDQWEDLFYLIFLNELEPLFEKKYPFIILKEFPAPLASLSKLNPEDSRVCKRFEVYVKGIEICNCFEELTNLEEQKLRFQQSYNERKEIYNQEMPTPNILFNSLEKGIGNSSGIALGVERLLLSIIPNSSPFFPSSN